MKCPNCKADIDDNSRYCDYCGTKITQNPMENNKNEITQEEFHRSYMGDNYYNFKNRFNIAALIFGGIYIFYRKQYVLGTIFTLLVIFTLYFTPTIAIIMHILLSMTYNQQYTNYVNKKTREIKIKNLNKPKKEILDICYEKGTTSIISAMIPIVTVLILIVVAINIFGTDLKGAKGKTIVKVSDNKINSLIYEVPKEFASGNYNTDEYRSYTYNKDKKYCRIEMQTRTDKNNFPSVETFLTNNITSSKTDTVTTPENITINKQLWKRVNVSNAVKTKSYYATKYGDLYYIINYDIYINNKENAQFCNEEYNIFMNSLNFRDN